MILLCFSLHCIMIQRVTLTLLLWGSCGWLISNCEGQGKYICLTLKTHQHKIT